MTCAAASYADERSSARTRAELRVHYQLKSDTCYCETCHAYHINVGDMRPPFDARGRAILKYIALGYRDREIAVLIERTPRWTERIVNSMIEKMYARSRSNLLAICIALGMLNPTDFVPQVTENSH